MKIIFCVFASVVSAELYVIFVGNALERSVCDETAGSRPISGTVKTVPYGKPLIILQ